MPAKKFIIPFAATGDKTAVPNTLQPDGTVSYAQGFGPDYELDKTLDPINAKDVPRDQTNQLYFDLTDAVGEQQLYGVALWGADRAPYPLNARAYHNDKLWRSNVMNNSGEPGVSGWEDVSVLSDTVNAPIATVAAAGTINLTTGAADTSQIAISGTGVNINGFTVAADRFFIVKMTGASNTLVNSASLVTGRGANIPVVAGDCFLMRSTAANTVEIVGGTFLIDRGIGTGQTWQDVSASRSMGVTYTNTTGRPIIVQAWGSTTSPTSNFFKIVVNGIDVSLTAIEAMASAATVSAIIPPGVTYSVVSSNVTLLKWMELRA